MIFFRKKPIATVAFNLAPRRSAFGGGNQWLNQLSQYLKRCGYEVVYELTPDVDCVMGTHAGLSGKLTITYDDVIWAKRRNGRLKCVQRINDNDVRKGTDKMDARLAEANTSADHTVFVSEWLRDHHAAKWFSKDRPHTVITNGADPAVFHPFGSPVWQPGHPLRLVTHHWSDNMAKGFDIYQEVDNLIASGDLKGVELWVIGRWPKQIKWKKARTFPPCTGDKLAGLLRQCHVGITASRHEPGAMHPVEAMQCGLPLFYHRDGGGTVELGQRFGVELTDNLAESIDALKDRYHHLRSLVLREAPAGDRMCAAYRQIIQSLINQ